MTEKKLLVVLQGIGNSGKTTVLKELLNLLLNDKQKISSDPESTTNKRNKDISPTVINFKKDASEGTIIVGIASAGDDKKIVEDNLDYLLKKRNCDIVFCATRSYGDTTEVVHTYIDNNSNILLLPFYKAKYNMTNLNQYNSQLAQEMLAIAKMRWNTINQTYNSFSFN